MNLISIIPNFILNQIRKSRFYENYQVKNEIIIKYSQINKVLDLAPPLINSYIKDNQKKPIIGIVKDNIYLRNEYVYPKASWLRYERFCKNNNLEYKFINISMSDWIEQCNGIDILIWHTSSDPSTQKIAESKIYIIEKELHKTCFPSYHEIWQYEDKVRANYLYKINNIEAIPTFITNNYNEAISKINDMEFPIISKICTGSGSKGVDKITSKNTAISLINDAFNKGKKSIWSYLKQKDYVYFQKFIDDAKYDLRIMITGNKAFGYYRYPKSGDFRASGSGLIGREEIPKEAIKIAFEIRKKLRCSQLGVDMLFSEKNNKYYIIETSTFNQIDTPSQLIINGTSGYYDISDINKIKFYPGKYWIQELTLEEIVYKWLLATNI